MPPEPYRQNGYTANSDGRHARHPGAPPPVSRTAPRLRRSRRGRLRQLGGHLRSRRGRADHRRHPRRARTRRPPLGPGRGLGRCRGGRHPRMAARAQGRPRAIRSARTTAAHARAHAARGRSLLRALRPARGVLRADDDGRHQRHARPPLPADQRRGVSCMGPARGARRVLRRTEDRGSPEQPRAVRPDRPRGPLGGAVAGEPCAPQTENWPGSQDRDSAVGSAAMATDAQTTPVEELLVTERPLWLDGPPYEVFKRLRGECPVHFTEKITEYPGEAGFWSVTKADDVYTVSRDWETYSSEMGGITALTNAVMPLELIQAMFIGMDPPKHDRLKALFQRGFTPKRIAEHEEEIRQITRDVLDRIDGQETCDLVWDVAQPVVSRVIGSFMGIA